MTFEVQEKAKAIEVNQHTQTQGQHQNIQYGQYRETQGPAGHQRKLLFHPALLNEASEKKLAQNDQNRRYQAL